MIAFCLLISNSICAAAPRGFPWHIQEGVLFPASCSSCCSK